jgi:hypothetical protein
LVLFLLTGFTENGWSCLLVLEPQIPERSLPSKTNSFDSPKEARNENCWIENKAANFFQMI